MKTALKTQPPMTYDDYLNLPDDESYELIGGELYMTPSPKSIHQTILGNVFTLLSNFVRETGAGRALIAPMDVKLTETEVVQPDILFINKERTHIIKEAFIAAAPDLTVEIISEGTRDRDTVLKKTLYYRHGVKEYWLVDPDTNSVTLLTPGSKSYDIHDTFAADEILASPLLPDFQPQITQFFST